MTELSYYKLTFHAGEYVDLNLAVGETQMDSIEGFLSGVYPIRKRVLSGIKVESNDFVYRYNYASAFTGYSGDEPQFTNLSGFHGIYKNTHRNSSKESQRQTEITNYLSLHETSENASLMLNYKTKINPPYSYHYYVSNDPDQAMRFDSFIERDTGVLTSSCGLLKRKGRVDIYESSPNSSAVIPCTDPIKLTLQGDGGEGGQLVVSDDDFDDLETYLDSQNIDIIAQVNLFD